MYLKYLKKRYFCIKIMVIFETSKQSKTNIMLHTKEFYEIMEVFEKNAKKLVSMGNQGLTREDKENWPNQNYYSDGNVNNAFKMFLHGVSLGKIL